MQGELVAFAAAAAFVAAAIFGLDWLERNFTAMLDEEEAAWGDVPHVPDGAKAAGRISKAGGASPNAQRPHAQGTSVTHSKPVDNS
jgi:hypothetical protein